MQMLFTQLVDAHCLTEGATIWKADKYLQPITAHAEIQDVMSLRVADQ